MTRTTLIHLALAAGVVFATSAPATADDALYAAPPPDDAVFLRWLNTGATPASLGLDVSPERRADFEFGYVSAKDVAGIAPGTHLSIVVDNEGTTHLVEEPARDALGKVHIVLVNTAATPVRLVVADGGPEVIGAINPLASGLRAVNPVTADLAVEAADTGAVIGTASLALQRGQDITILVSPDAVAVIEDTFGAGALLP